MFKDALQLASRRFAARAESIDHNAPTSLWMSLENLSSPRRAYPRRRDHEEGHRCRPEGRCEGGFIGSIDDEQVEDARGAIEHHLEWRLEAIRQEDSKSSRRRDCGELDSLIRGVLRRKRRSFAETKSARCTPLVAVNEARAVQAGRCGCKVKPNACYAQTAACSRHDHDPGGGSRRCNLSQHSLRLGGVEHEPISGIGIGSENDNVSVIRRRFEQPHAPRGRGAIESSRGLESDRRIAANDGDSEGGHHARLQECFTLGCGVNH
jgi:hypothetical protein